jgi:DNA-binding NarL/FixJ family response regulator
MKKASSISNYFESAGPRSTKANPHGEAGQGQVNETLPPVLSAEGAILTKKELQLLELLSYGYENCDIAEHLHTSVQAVKNTLRTINLKLGADNRTHAVAISFRNGWLPLKAARPEI